MEGMAKHLIITVHGIRTFGGWQDKLKDVLDKEAPGRFKVWKYRYGYFPAPAFLLPPLRYFMVRKFIKDLRAECTDEGWAWERVHIVAHSFGTHLAAHGLRRMKPEDRPSIHTFVLAGSVLKPTFDWAELMKNSVHRIVNECGVNDRVLVANQAIVLMTGMAGRLGFVGFENDLRHNRYYTYGHSGYFKGDRMTRNWLPLLTGSVPFFL